MPGLGMMQAPPQGQQMDPQQAMSPGQPMPPGGPQGGLGAQPMDGPTPATPDEQEMYGKVVAMAMLAIYNKEFIPQATKALQGAEDPAEAIGVMAAGITKRVVDVAREQGAEIPGEVLLHAGKEIVELVSEFAEASGIEISDEQMEQAYYLGLDQFRSMMQQEGRYDPAAAEADVQRIAEMDRSGQIARLVGGQPSGQAMPVAAGAM